MKNQSSALTTLIRNSLSTGSTCQVISSPCSSSKALTTSGGTIDLKEIDFELVYLTLVFDFIITISRNFVNNNIYTIIIANYYINFTVNLSTNNSEPLYTRKFIL